MQFNSIAFLFCFLPLFLYIYYSVGQGLRPTVLVAVSFVFYAMASNGNYWWVALLGGITLASYLVQRFLQSRPRVFLLCASIILLAGILCFLKIYRGGVLLPAGASFYLFQVVAILVDVYRWKVSAYKNIILYARDVVMFPKLLSGPIVQPEALFRCETGSAKPMENIRLGLQTLVFGLTLKVVFANNLGGLWVQPTVMGYAYTSTPAVWLSLIGYAMQLYLDFYGYSLMAVGIGKMLGFELPMNFLEPYSARTISDFYRRWHATLGQWFKSYIYIPLGGNRKGMRRTLLNVAVVWLFTGLWHGVGGNYLLWAGFLCLLIINERLWLGKLLEKSRFFSHIYVIGMILISWIPFAIGDWQEMVLFCSRLLGLAGDPTNPTEYIQWLRMYDWILIGSTILMTPLPGKLWKKIHGTIWGDIVTVILFWVVVYYLSTAAQNPFMYFQY